MNRFAQLRTVLPLVALCGLLAAPAAAQAIEVDDDGFQINFEDLGDVANVVQVNGVDNPEGTDDVVTITDTAFPVTIGENTEGNCVQDGANTVVCTSEELFEWNGDVAGGADFLTASGNMFGGIEGGPDNDVLIGSDTAPFERLEGDAGDDQMNGRAGAEELVGGTASDTVVGGPGNDTFRDFGGQGNDAYDGGEGLDFVGYFNDQAPPNFDVFNIDLTAGLGSRTNNGPETDSLAGIEDAGTSGGMLILFGFGPNSPQFGGNDTLTGNAGSNVLDSGDGDDQVNPLGGADTVDAGRGNDSVNTSDGAGDRVFCDLGTDTVVADQFDTLSECENVTTEQRRAEGADVTAPDCAVAQVKKSYSRSAFNKGITARLTCDEAGTAELELVATVKGKQLTAKVGDLVLAQKSATVGTAAKRVKLKPAKKFVRRLAKKGIKARLIVDVRDQYGNRSIERKSIKVKKNKSKRRKRNKRR